jgi:hypothetical protein
MKKYTKVLFWFSLCFTFFTTVICFSCGFEGKKEYEIAPQKKKLSLWAEFLDDYDIQFATVASSQNLGKTITWTHNVGDTIGERFDIVKGKIVPRLFDVNDRDGFLFDTVAGAKVRLYEDNKLFIDFKPQFPYDLRGSFNASLFPNNFKFQPNKEYKLVVSAPGYDTLVARQKAVKSAKLRGFSYQRESAVLPNVVGSLSEFFLEIDDDPNEENYYAVDILRRGIDTTFIGSTPVYIEEKYTPLPLFKTDINATTAKVISDRNFNGQRYKWRVGTYSYACDGCSKTTVQTIVVLFRSVSKDYNNYQRQIDILNAANDNPFAEPFKLTTNTEGGYGYFLISGTPDTITRTIVR